MSESELIRLRKVMNQLRSPGGCDWDAKQTHESLLKYLLEESYEFIDAVEKNDRAAIQEELGDLLLQVYFHSRIAEEHAKDPFDIEDVAKTVADKLINRHPHVFSSDEKIKQFDKLNNTVSDEERVSAWERVKATEKQRTSALDGVALNQPALTLSTKILERIKRLQIKNIKISEAPISNSKNDLSNADVFGDLILTLINQAIENGIDPETALRAANYRLITRLKEIESAT
jgi:XTP/dITP diphosphohydrolase